MDAKATYLTSAGEAELRSELQHLITVRRPELAQKLKVAVAQGDLKENADYHDAKEQLGFIEGRVRQLEGILRDAVVVEAGEGNDEVRVGSTVIILEDGEDESEEYQIVGSAEANPRQRKISLESPIGAALLGKNQGKKIKVQTPDGVVRFKIVAVR
ncbi:MAG: transcription elongation factor GreA [Chloroflexi bacterium]|nr:transcription elongation factor GreA [Chloroflexota bacterium]